MTVDIVPIRDRHANGQRVLSVSIAYLPTTDKHVIQIAVPLPVRDLAADDAVMLRTEFEKEYAVLFRRPLPGAAIEVLSWSVLVSTQARRPQPIAPVAARRAGAPDGNRRFFDGRAGGMIDVPLYRREHMEPGVWLPGPAIIAEDETSTFVTASYDARIDAAGCIVMERRAT